MKPSEFDARLSDLESEIAKLRAIYEQWFQGIERRPPIRARERLDRQVRRMRREAPNNTALRFKYQTIFQRWITFTQHWDRITRRIEEGTYARDVRRAQRRRAAIENRPEKGDEARSEEPPSVDVELDMDMDVDAEINAALEALGGAGPSSRPAPTQPTALSLPDMDLDEHPAESIRPAAQPPARPSPPRPPARSAPKAPPPARAAPKAPPPPARSAPKPPPPPARAAPKAPPPPPGRSARGESALRDDDVRRIFDRYVEARKQVGKRPDGVSYEKLASQIRKMEPQLRKKHAGKRIDFEVVVKDGRVGLKPVAGRKPGDD